MRFTKTIPAFGTRRTITKFLWFPTEIWTVYENGAREVERRWLETATWEESWTNGRTGNYWRYIRWIDKDEQHE